MHMEASSSRGAINIVFGDSLVGLQLRPGSGVHTHDHGRPAGSTILIIRSKSAQKAADMYMYIASHDHMEICASAGTRIDVDIRERIARF